MIKFPKSFWRIAEEIGNARNVLDTHIRENDPYYERGDKRLYDAINRNSRIVIIRFYYLCSCICSFC